MRSTALPRPARTYTSKDPMRGKCREGNACPTPVASKLPISVRVPAPQLALLALYGTAMALLCLPVWPPGPAFILLPRDTFPDVLAPVT